MQRAVLSSSFSKKHLYNFLLIPGPVTTSPRIKEVVKPDHGSRDTDIVCMNRNIRRKLLDIVKVDDTKYSSVLFQGCGTYANEAVLSSLPENTRLGVFSNGTYGKRLSDIATMLDIPVKHIEFDPSVSIQPNMIQNHIENLTHVAMVHNETSLGTINNINKIGELLKENNIEFIIDAISSFGGIPIDMAASNIDYIVGSSNKCLHSYPGLSFVVANRLKLKKNKTSKSLSLHLYEQWKEFEENEQFRYTPPVQMITSLNEAINELYDEGGVESRYKKYCSMNAILKQKMGQIGMHPIVASKDQGPILMAFDYPYRDFSYKELYNRLKNKHSIIIYTAEYQGREVLRLGNIGHMSVEQFSYNINLVKKEIMDMMLLERRLNTK